MRRSRLILWKLRDANRGIPNGVFVLLVCAFVAVAFLLTSGEAAVRRGKATATTFVPDAAATSTLSNLAPNTIPPGIVVPLPLKLNAKSAGGTAAYGGGGRRGAVAVARRRAITTRRTTRHQRRTPTPRTRTQH